MTFTTAHFHVTTAQFVINCTLKYALHTVRQYGRPPQRQLGFLLKFQLKHLKVTHSKELVGLGHMLWLGADRAGDDRLLNDFKTRVAAL